MITSVSINFFHNNLSELRPYKINQLYVLTKVKYSIPPNCSTPSNCRFICCTLTYCTRVNRRLSLPSVTRVGGGGNWGLLHKAYCAYFMCSLFDLLHSFPIGYKGKSFELHNLADANQSKQRWIRINLILPCNWWSPHTYGHALLIQWLLSVKSRPWLWVETRSNHDLDYLK